jgi:archaellum component FlaC
MGGFMSLTETLMLVALGFALALLVVLLFGRGFWAIATSFGAKRKVKNIPLEMLELQADRDRLRAEHAIMSRKLELRLEEIKGRMTAQMAEVSRSRNRVQTLVEQLETSEATVATRDREVAELSAQIEDLKSGLETTTASLNSFTLDNNQKNSEIAKLSQSVAQLKQSLSEAKSLAASMAEEAKAKLRTQTAAVVHPLHTEIEDTNMGEGRMKKRISQLTSISREMDDTQMRGLQNFNASMVEAPLFESEESKTNLELDDAAREAQTLTAEFEAIEKAQSQNRSSLYPPPKPVKPSARANIISLAQRIKSLQGNEK